MLEQLHFLNPPLLTILRIPAQPRTQGALIEPVFALIGTVLALQTGIYYEVDLIHPLDETHSRWLLIVNNVEVRLRRKGVKEMDSFSRVFRKWYSRTFVLLKASMARA